MTDNNNRVVQGFYVKSVMIKKDSIKAKLVCNKDDLRAGDGDVGDVVQSLELHATAGEDAPVMASLLRNDLEITTYSCPFIVNTYTVSQDGISIILVAVQTDGVNMSDVSKSLTMHADGGDERQVELTVSRTDA